MAKKHNELESDWKTKRARKGAKDPLAVGVPNPPCVYARIRIITYAR